MSLPLTPDRPAIRSTGFTEGAVSQVLRAEGLVALAAAVIAFRAGGASWAEFAALFLAPDLAMLGYLADRPIGTTAYNVAHTYLAPACLAAAGGLTGAHWVWPVALIWTAHIGFDRLLGYGLKYPTAFGDTHLGRVGRRADS